MHIEKQAKELLNGEKAFKYLIRFRNLRYFTQIIERFMKISAFQVSTIPEDLEPIRRQW